MNRREFATTLGAAVAGIVAGRALLADDKPAAKDKSKDHVCAGKNACKGQGACGTKDSGCAGQNDCKGKGGCATKDNTCAGQNDCKGKGGCQVPLKKKDAPAASKSKAG
jgi:hypothetical protein